MDKKVALITGASSGIGKALAQALGDDGYRLALTSRKRANIEELCRVYDAVGFEIDLHTDEGPGQLVEAFLDRFDRIDVLVNSAGVLHRGMYDLDAQAFDQMWRLNLRAPFLLMKGLVPLMERQGRGHVFNISSRSGKVGFPGAGAYSSSKFGLNGLNEATYRGFAEKGIKVTALCPSWVDTPMADGAGCRLVKEERIPTADLALTMRWLLGLSPVSCVKEVMIECRSDVF